MEPTSFIDGQFHALANLMPTLCWVANADGWIYWYNSRWYEYTGTTPAQMEGWGWQSVHDPNTLQDVLRNWRASIETGQPFEMTFPLRSAQGDYRPFLTRISPIVSDDGRITGWLGVNTDVTQERIAADLREQFMAVLGHDLRNPLQAIVSGLSALAQTSLDSRGKRLAHMMQRSASRMGDLIQDVMDMAQSRLGSGIDLKRIVTDSLEPVLQGVIDELLASQPSRLVVTDFQLDAPVDCDPGRIAQLFSNLLGNAFSYGATNQAIDVRATATMAGFTLSVSNGGSPIPASELDRLFQPFFRGSDAGPSRQGLGLGLYIAHEIASAHGGTLEVASSSESTCFTLQMPMRV